MAIKSQQLRQSFLVSGAGIAVLLVLFVAWITSNRVGNVLEQQADVRGRDVATRVAAIVTQYLKERRREVVSLASEPGLLGAVRDAGQAAVTRSNGSVPPSWRGPLNARSRSGIGIRSSPRVTAAWPASRTAPSSPGSPASEPTSRRRSFRYCVTIAATRGATSRPRTSACCSSTLPTRLLVIQATNNTSSTRSEEHTSELQSRLHLVCRLL